MLYQFIGELVDNFVEMVDLVAVHKCVNLLDPENGIKNYLQKKRL